MSARRRRHGGGAARRLRRRLAPALCLLLAGCASPLPETLRHAPVSPLGVARVRAAPQRYLGHWVRWGGRLVGIENGARETRLEILSLPLDAEGRPDPAGPAGPRFLARVAGFLDPARYAVHRRVTLAGRILGGRTRPVGAYPYRYVELEVRALYLWPAPRRPRPCCPDLRFGFGVGSWGHGGGIGIGF